MRRLLRDGGTLVLLVTLTLAAFALLPSLLGWRTAVVVTGSMSPAVRPGDVIAYEPCGPGGVVPGRIVLVPDPSRPGELLSHRVRAVGPDGSVTTKGDANPVADSAPVPAGRILGCARLVVPYVGLPRLIADPQQHRRAVPFTGVVLLAAWFVLRGTGRRAGARGGS